MLLLQATTTHADLPGGYGVALVQALLALVAVCILAWTVLRWTAGRGLGALGGGQRIEVLERTHLDAKRTLYLVKIGERAFLVGAGDGGAPALLAEIPTKDLPPAKPAVRFADVLRRQREAPKPASDDAGAS
ncbi:MAG: flagellar biosynthetic protein FliO [Sandaracinus sp.]